MSHSVVGTICLCFCLYFGQLNGLKGQLSEDAYISLITCRPGDEIFTSWGHTAIRVYDKNNKINHIFNYGMFSFNEPNFLLKFLRGKLLYWVGVEDFNAFYYAYNEEKRTLIEQKLNLDQSQKNKIFKALNENLKPENRKYLYDFFFDNCSTRPRDILLNDLHLKTNIKQQTDITFRQLIDRYIISKPWTDFGVDLIVGSLADKTASREQQMFLPEILSSQLDSIDMGEKSFIASKEFLLEYEDENLKRQQAHFLKPLYLFILLLILEFYLFVKYRTREPSKWIEKYDNIWILLFGISSILIAFMWFGTDHIATKNNLNLLWLNPLFLILFFYKKKNLKVAILTCLILTLIGSTFYQELHIASIILVILMILKLVRKMDNPKEIRPEFAVK